VVSLTAKSFFLLFIVQEIVSLISLSPEIKSIVRLDSLRIVPYHQRLQGGPKNWTIFESL